MRLWPLPLRMARSGNRAERRGEIWCLLRSPVRISRQEPPCRQAARYLPRYAIACGKPSMPTIGNAWPRCAPAPRARIQTIEDALRGNGIECVTARGQRDDLQREPRRIWLIQIHAPGLHQRARQRGRGAIVRVAGAAAIPRPLRRDRRDGWGRFGPHRRCGCGERPGG